MSAAPVRSRRKAAFNLFREADKLASYDEFPMLRREVDPQLHVSRNTVDQPFHLICEKDSVLAQVSGASRLMFEGGPVRYFDLGPGDHSYVPGGTPHRVLVIEPGIQMRYKAREPGLEAAVWYCASCGGEAGRHQWDNAVTAAQDGYQDACERRNAPDRRRCAQCDAPQPEIDLSPFRWRAVAAALRAEEAE